MAIEKARELLKKLNEDEALRAAFQADPKAALAAGDYGGGIITEGAEHRGGCQYNFWVQECAATVEKGSWCGSNDYCAKWEVQYSTLTNFTQLCPSDLNFREG